MRKSRELPLLMPSVSGQRFSCQRCSQCCWNTIVDLTEDDRRRLDAQDWSDEIASEPYVRVGTQWMLSKTAEGACVFLNGEGRCRIHAKYGPHAKPFACTAFPFAVMPDSHKRWRTSWRFDCPSVARSRGRPMAEYTDQLAKLAHRLERRGRRAPGLSQLRRGVPVRDDEIDALVKCFDEWFQDSRRSWPQRMAGAIRATDTLASIPFVRSPGERFEKYLFEVFRHLTGKLEGDALPAPGRYQRRVLRELVFAHADRSGFRKVRASGKGRMLHRLKTILAAVAFRGGKGTVPQLYCLPANVRFTDIDQVPPAHDEGGAIAELLTRYVRMRLQSRTFFGRGFYGWPLLDGLRALWASIVLTAWIARWLAAGEQHSMLTYDHVVRAIGVVDASSPQLPAQRRTTFRLRLAYLAGSDGMLRLLEAYPLVKVEGAPCHSPIAGCARLSGKP
jgi:lysine-N-methylase